MGMVCKYLIIVEFKLNSMEQYEPIKLTSKYLIIVEFKYYRRRFKAIQ